MPLSFFNTIFVSSHMYPENPAGTQVIVGSMTMTMTITIYIARTSRSVASESEARWCRIYIPMNMGYISDTARNRTHNLFRPKREPIPLGHSDGHLVTRYTLYSTLGMMLLQTEQPALSRAGVRITSTRFTTTDPQTTITIAPFLR